MTATETALLAAATAEGTTEIRHAAGEPHVAELARFLRRMGADVVGRGHEHAPRRRACPAWAGARTASTATSSRPAAGPWPPR